MACNMRGAWFVTGLTRDAGDEGSPRRELAANAGRRRMATETAHHFGVGDGAFHRFCKIWKECKQGAKGE